MSLKTIYHAHLLYIQQNNAYKNQNKMYIKSNIYFFTKKEASFRCFLLHDNIYFFNINKIAFISPFSRFGLR